MTNITGYVAAGFEPVREAFEQNFEDGLELGCGFAAYQGDTLLVHLTGGWADRKKTRAWDDRTLVPVYSTTKGIAALVLARALHDKFDAPYDMKVVDLWPEFAAHGKDQLTLGELLSHQAGLPGFINPIDPDLWFDNRALAAELAATEPMWTPGDGSGYHPLTWGYLVSEVAIRATGKTCGQLLKEYFTNCDGGEANKEIIDFWLGTPASEHNRCAEIKRPTAPPDLGALDEFKKAAFLTKWAAPNRGGAEWRETEIPSANGHGTAKAVARLYGLYANHGVMNGDTLISDTAYNGLIKRRCQGEDRVLPFNMEFAAGVMRNSNKIYGPNVNTLAHAGWGGSFGLGDPDRGLSAAYVMNRQTNALQTDERAQRLIGALYGCL